MGAQLFCIRPLCSCISEAPGGQPEPRFYTFCCPLERQGRETAAERCLSRETDVEHFLLLAC